MMGMSILITFILCVIGTVDKKSKIMYFYLGLGTLFIAVYGFYCLYRPFFGSMSTFLNVKKLLFFSSYLSSIFLMLGIENYVKKHHKFRYVLFIGVGIAEIMVLKSNSFIQLRHYINYLNLIIVFAPLYTMYLLMRYKKKRLYLTIGFATLVLVATVISNILKCHIPYLFPYGIIAYSIGLSVSIVFEYTRLNQQKKEIYSKSLIDHLTGAYNRNILEEIQLEGNEIIIFIDMDNFKYYNDTYGHIRGDQLLKDCVITIKKYTHYEDKIIRYGGDEFLLLLYHTSISRATHILQSIKDEFRKMTSLME